MAESGPWRYGTLLGQGWSREATRSAVGRGELRRVTRGVYADKFDVLDLRALFLRLPPGATLGFQSAARLFGWPVPEVWPPRPTRPVHVIVPAGTVVPHIKGVVTHESVTPMAEPVLLSGVPCAPPARCAVDLARHLRRPDALALLDGALRSALCLPDDLAVEVLQHRGLRGVCQARELITKADPRAECSQESHLRLVLLDGRLPPPEPQIRIADDGVLLYRLDLGYREHRVGIEYEGGSHLDRDRMRHDRARLNWLADHGWQMRIFTDRDLYSRPGHVVQTVAALLRTTRP